MEFYHLRSFIVVSETKNLTKAAKFLYTTPPAISAHIKALEEELKTPLFTRSSRGMTLTEEGELLLPKARATLNAALDLVNTAAKTQDEVVGHFRLGINQASQQMKLVELAESMQSLCSGISLEVELSSSGKILHAIEQGNLDGGYIYGDVPVGFMGINLTEQAITTIAPKGMVDSQLLVISDLAKYPWVMMGSNCPFDTQLKTILPQVKVANIQSSNEQSRIDLVEAGLGLSFIEDYLVDKNHKQLEKISLLDFKLPLCFVVAERRVSEPVVKVMLEQIKSIWSA